jgi:hypothetical protein
MNRTPEAQLRLNNYLAKMRWSLRGTSVDGEEIARDIHEHVESALADLDPADVADLEPVLQKLGPPHAWISENELPFVRRVIRYIQYGPESWRLPYLTFAATMLGIILLPVGIGVVIFLGAFVLARAAVEEIGPENLGPRRWLVYSPIAIVLTMLSLLIVIGPVPPIIAWGFQETDFVMKWFGGGTDSNSVDWFRVHAGAIAAAFGAWWIVLSAIVALAYRPLRFLYVPLSLRWRRRVALVPLLSGIVVGVIGMIALTA